MDSRPTVEDATRAHTVYSWAYRGDVGEATRAVRGAGPTQLLAMMTGAALVAHIAADEYARIHVDGAS